MRGLFRNTALLVALAPALQAQGPERARVIADNSFLIEEAYNQEPGVVQHISAFVRERGAGFWAYTFTQEWPFLDQKHQLSFTLPVQHIESPSTVATRVSDVALNYRYQLVGTNGTVSVAPRFSLLLPTGSAKQGVGAGAFGIQWNVPVSAKLAKRLVAHWNIGATVNPSARNALGAKATTAAYNLGASAVWLVHPAFNVLVEAAWTRAEAVAGPGGTTASSELFINPGIRWAHDFAGGLQIVPGIGFPIGVGPSDGDHSVFFYLSFEHPFRKVGR